MTAALPLPIGPHSYAPLAERCGALFREMVELDAAVTAIAADDAQHGSILEYLAAALNMLAWRAGQLT